MQFTRISLKKLLPIACAVSLCAVPMLWPTGLSVEGHGIFSTDLSQEFWDKIRRIYPSNAKPTELKAVTQFKRRLAAEGRDLNMHGVYLETLDSHEPIAAFNETSLFNPASVMKVVTSIAALDKLGANYRFSTQFRTTGKIVRSTGELKGDLLIVSGLDPAFSVEDARNAGAMLRKLGVSRVTGGLQIIGAFTCNENSNTEISAGVLRRNLGISIQGKTALVSALPKEKTGLPIFTLESDTLMNILREQNAHSVNSMADAVGEFIGGSEAVRQFLVERIGLHPEEIFISRASGLEANRLTAWGTAKILRGAISWLNANGYKPEDLMPIAGIDPSTVGGRFTEPGFAGSVIAKTGTLHETDNGAANLAGIAYTKDKGAILFVIYDMAEGRNPAHLRGVQDEFLKNLMNELGGPKPVGQRNNQPASNVMAGRIVLAE